MRAHRFSLGAVPLLVAFAFLVGFHRAGTSDAVPTSARTAPSPTDDTDAGEHIWLRDCAICHGEEAEGTERAPSLQGVGPAGVDFMISTGRMPLGDPDDEPTRGPVRYDEAETRALLAHAETFISGPDVPSVDLAGVDVAAGGEHYRTNCASCHQMAGQGGILPSGRNVPPLGSATPIQVVEAMRSGPSDMPIFTNDILDDAAAADVAAYVDVLQEPNDRGGWDLGHWGPVPEGAAAFVFGVIPLVLIARWLGDRNPTSASTTDER